MSPSLAAEHLARIAGGLAAGLPATALAPTDLGSRQWRRLIVTDDYDAWLIHWPTGGSVTPHDHGGSTGAFAVASGELVEVVLEPDRTVSRVLGVGEVMAVADDTVHDVVNDGASPATSVHVYSPPLTSMAYYDAALALLGEEAVDAESPAWSMEALAPVAVIAGG